MLPLNAYPQINTTAQIVITEQIKHIVVTSSEITYLAIPDTDTSFPKYIIYILKKTKTQTASYTFNIQRTGNRM